MRTLIWFNLLGFVALLALTRVAPRYWEPDSARAVSAAAVICFGAALLALVPMAVIAPRRSEWLLHAGMATIAIRLLVTLSAGAAYVTWLSPPPTVFMNAMVACYLPLLAIETAIAIRLGNRHWRTTLAR